MNNYFGVDTNISGSSLYLDLEAPIHHQSQDRRIPPSMNMMTGIDDDQDFRFMGVKGSNSKRFSINFEKGKGVATSSMIDDCNDEHESDEDDHGFREDRNASEEKGRKGTPWQRMKWTDERVRLLIQVVSCVGDDGSLEGVDGFKRISGSLQKKGKWKTVSKIMVVKGCHVSPQQCEDKFNDLNKRYKRLNDILGRGTCCKVVENPTLMDSMPKLTAKMKDDVKKILSSKHLFYPEMCAYHNGQKIPNCGDLDLQVRSLRSVPMSMSKGNNNGPDAEEAEETDQSEDDDSEEEDSDTNRCDEDMERVEDHGERMKGNGDRGFQAEMNEFFRNSTISKLEKRKWIRKRLLQLQEQQVGIQAEGFEIEKRRFKWQRFCHEKNRELEISRLEIERSMLENEQMSLRLKKKKLEMQFSSSGPSSFDPTSLSLDRPQGRA